ncbi:serine/threonine-protein phosphatase 6 regulatory ankyrin repeat subunit A-like [Penaeus chinensis]|uniref:serine/threonine-protein phosphatase 6 regulatory ankyrin repeat subunit A-like n=1 Tax=Penaeus chinensis TaxID=139456 RepID=UPI001FB62939|nr:serine/threonine-protein phosphatase 6 regulatory ankyrin repeat subunit A-like [Penaeus chinensis]XP_047481856.1 serine/threonine-protein phosphatase 6 regulatory ankyrin repeat subunit A-like [Penaeus chinensis]
MLALLKAQESDLSVVDLQGRSPLHVAAERGQVSAAQWLLREGASVDAASGDKQTPLDVARALGHKDIVALLEEALLADAKDVTDPAEDAEESLPPTDSEKDTKAAKIMMLVGDELDAADLCPLHQCVLAGDADAVQELIDGGTDIHEKGPGGRFAVHIAAEKGHLDVLQVLIEAGCEITMGDGKGRQPIHLAALGGHAALLKVLIDNSASLQNYDRKGMRAIHYAAAGGSEVTLDLLLGFKCDLDLVDASSRTPLHLAVLEGQCGAVEWLLTKGATASKRDIRNQSPLDVARALGRREIEELLERRSRRAPRLQIADERDKNKKKEKVHRRKDSGTSDLNSQILLTSREGDAKGVKRLADAGAHLEAISSLPTEKGLRPVHLASRSGHSSTLQALVSAGADPHSKGPDGFRAVHYASKGGHVEVLKVLQALKVDLRALTDAGETALHVAAACGNLAAVKWLAEQAGFRDAALLAGEGSALQAAREARKKDIVKYLVHFQLVHALLAGDDKALDQMSKDGINLDPDYIYNKEHGFRSVHYAAKGGHLSVLKLLNRAQCKLKATTPEGLTALHVAAEDGHLAATKWLVAFGGLDAGRASRAGLTAMDLAARAGSAGVVAYLQDHDVLKALLEGDTQAVRRVLQTRTDIDKLCMEKNIKGFQAVHYAAKGGQVPILKILKENKCNLKGVTYGGLTALHYAVRYAQLDVVKRLVEEGELDVSCRSKKGSSALDFARDRKKQEIAAYLGSLNQGKEGSRRARGRPKLEKEKKPLVVQTQGTVTDLNSEILTMAQKGDAEGVKRLVKQGADLEVQNPRARERGLRPLHLCSLAGHTAALEALIECGADIHSTGPQGLSAVHYASKGGHVEVLKVLQQLDVDLTVLTDAKETALHVAADFGNLAAVKWLVELGGFKRNSLSREAGSAFDLAWNSDEKAVVQYLMNVQLLNAVICGDLSTVKELIEGGIEIDDVNVVGRREGFRIVHHAAVSGDLKILKLLKQVKCNMKAVTEKGLTALHVAAHEGNAAAVRWLVERGGFATDGFSGAGVRPEQLARRGGHEEVVRYLHDILLMARHGDTEGVKGLVKEKTSLEVISRLPRERGMRALHLAAWSGHVGVVRELITGGADSRAKGPGGFRAVHYASKGGHVEVLKVLQALKVDLRALTDAGETALHVAASCGNLAAVKWLAEQAGFRDAALLAGEGSALQAAREARKMSVVKYLASVPQVTGN